MKPVLFLVVVLSLFLMGMSPNPAGAQVNLPEPVVNPPAVIPLPGPNVLYLHSVYQDRWVRMFFRAQHYGATRLTASYLAKCDSVDFFMRASDPACCGSARGLRCPSPCRPGISGSDMFP